MQWPVHTPPGRRLWYHSKTAACNIAGLTTPRVDSYAVSDWILPLHLSFIAASIILESCDINGNRQTVNTRQWLPML